MTGDSGYHVPISAREANYARPPGYTALALHQVVAGLEAGGKVLPPDVDVVCPAVLKPVERNGRVYSNMCYAENFPEGGTPVQEYVEQNPHEAWRFGGNDPYTEEESGPDIMFAAPRGAKHGGWLQKADASMERRGTEGKFTAAAERAGMSVQKYAGKVIKEMKAKEKKGTKLTKRESKLYKRAVFARNMGKIAKKNRRKK